MKPLVLVGLLLLNSASLAAQDAVKTLPANYRVEFENEFVRVTRVHYGPHARLPGHTHTALACAYVYLNDSGPVVFRHIGLEYGAVTRPPTVARSFRLFRGLEEIHEVDNLSEQPSDFLRVEFKTDPGGDPRTLRGKFMPPPLADIPSHKLEFENAQIRVIRVTAPAGRSIRLDASDVPSVFVSLTEGELGKAFWLPRGERRELTPSAHRLEALRFELKTGVKPTP